MKNKKIGLVIVGIIVLAGIFYGGMVYGGNNVRASINARGQAFGQNGTMMGNRGTRTISGFTGGQIISKDANSITVSMQNNTPGSTGQSGSKIIFMDSNTKITKQTNGTVSDLAVGTQISVTGTANTDGSVSAQSVQIRPATVRPNTTP